MSAVVARGVAEAVDEAYAAAANGVLPYEAVEVLALKIAMLVVEPEFGEDDPTLEARRASAASVADLVIEEEVPLTRTEHALVKRLIARLPEIAGAGSSFGHA